MPGSLWKRAHNQVVDWVVSGRGISRTGTAMVKVVKKVGGIRDRDSWRRCGYCDSSIVREVPGVCMWYWC